MSTHRIFNSSKFFQPVDTEPIRSVVTESKDAVVVAWYIKPGQKIPPHIHPNGQDTWTGSSPVQMNYKGRKSLSGGN